MQFLKLGEFLAATHISGVTHNLLKIRLTECDQGATVSCECLPANGGCQHEPIDEQALIEFVLSGVKQANEKLGTSYRVTHIQYVANDTPPESKYGYMAARIVEHVHVGGAWAIGGT
jgi:hypothetical protein